MLGLTSRTLRRYSASSRRPERSSPGGHRIFSFAEPEAILHQRGDGSSGEGGDEVVLYARVSSRNLETGGVRVCFGGHKLALLAMTQCPTDTRITRPGRESGSGHALG